MEIKNRQKFLAITAGVALGLLIANSIIVNPLLKSWSDRSDRIKKLKLDFAQGKQLIAQRPRILAQWRGMETNALPNNISAAGGRLLQAKDRWEQLSGLKVENITPNWKPDADLTTLECPIDATGSMQNILSFLWNVQNDPMGLKIEDVDITARDNDGRVLSLRLVLSGLILGTAQPAEPMAP